MRYVITLLFIVVNAILPAYSVDDQPLGFITDFQNFCLDTELDAESFAAMVEERRLQPAPREQVTQFMRGILPYHVDAYRLGDGNYLAWTVSGNITGEQMRLNRLGERVTTDPIHPDVLVGALLVLGGPEVLGGKSCRVFSLNDDLFEDYIADVYLRMNDVGVNFRRIPGTPHVEFSVSNSVWPGDDEASYLLPE